MHLHLSRSEQKEPGHYGLYSLIYGNGLHNLYLSKLHINLSLFALRFVLHWSCMVSWHLDNYIYLQKCQRSSGPWGPMFYESGPKYIWWCQSLVAGVRAIRYSKGSKFVQVNYNCLQYQLISDLARRTGVCIRWWRRDKGNGKMQKKQDHCISLYLLHLALYDVQLCHELACWYLYFIVTLL